MKKGFLIIDRNLRSKLITPVYLRVKKDNTLYEGEVFIPMPRALRYGIYDYSYGELLGVGNMFELSEGVLTFTSKPEKQVYTMQNVFSKRGRQEMKISKFVNLIISTFGLVDADSGDNIVSAEVINRFIELMTFKIEDRMVYPIQVSDHIEEIYKLPTSESKSGSLGKSCMRPEVHYLCKDNVGVYAILDVKVAFMVNEHGQLISRALLWDNCKYGDYSGDGETFKLMDRIYGTGQAENSMKKWARENGYAYKRYQTYENPTLDNAPFGKKEVVYWIDLPPGGFPSTRVPYFDSLKYHDRHRNRMAAYNITGKYMFLVQNCAGSLIGTTSCPSCGRNAHPDGLYDIGRGGSKYTACDYCSITDIDNKRRLQGDCVYSKVYGGWLYARKPYIILSNRDVIKPTDKHLYKEHPSGEYVPSDEYKKIINEQSKHTKKSKRGFAFYA